MKTAAAAPVLPAQPPPRTVARPMRDDAQRSSRETGIIAELHNRDRAAREIEEELRHHRPLRARVEPGGQRSKRAVLKSNERILAMLYTIAVVLLILWLLGLVTSYTIGGFIHVLLVIAIVVILLNVIGGRKAL
jgi:uncharacterized membrane protein